MIVRRHYVLVKLRVARLGRSDCFFERGVNRDVVEHADRRENEDENESLRRGGKCSETIRRRLRRGGFGLGWRCHVRPREVANSPMGNGLSCWLSSQESGADSVVNSRAEFERDHVQMRVGVLGCLGLIEGHRFEELGERQATQKLRDVVVRSTHTVNAHLALLFFKRNEPEATSIPARIEACERVVALHLLQLSWVDRGTATIRENARAPREPR